MKTTVEIPDSLLDEARKVAAKEGRPVRALVEEGLRKVLAERKRATAFRLRKATFKGQGLQPHLADAAWERIRDTAYEGRGA
jgi:putative antitoxin of VapBC-like toxin-antitoxin system